MLVSHFAVEVLAYAVMSNHSHFVLWVRPSAAAEWHTHTHTQKNKTSTFLNLSP
jgi:hypothetical protein